MGRTRRHILTIAGFDPSGGAGVLADVKTFEQLKVYGQAVITANTIQSADQFLSVNWVDQQLVLEQLKLILKTTDFDFVKIGLVRDLAQFNELVDLLYQHNPKVKIIWDPVLKASAGFEFHQNLKVDLQRVFLMTPNLDEIKAFGDPVEVASDCNVLLKGGHAEEEKGIDLLYTKGKQFKFKPKNTEVEEKHGSGCVLSSAITAFLAKGYPLNKACLRGKDYVTKVLGSNPTKLGYHKL